MNQCEGKPEAHWLADALETGVRNGTIPPGASQRAAQDAAALLRSQAAEIERLRERARLMRNGFLLLLCQFALDIQAEGDEVPAHWRDYAARLVDEFPDDVSLDAVISAAIAADTPQDSPEGGR